MKLEERIVPYYMDGGYNCAEALLLAANDHYGLNIHPDDIKMISGFGAGMFCAQQCGALSASIAALSKAIIETKAHDHIPELRAGDTLVFKNFKKHLGGTDCAALKPEYFDKETRCLKTVQLAARAFEESMAEILGDQA